MTSPASNSATPIFTCDFVDMDQNVKCRNCDEKTTIKLRQMIDGVKKNVLCVGCIYKQFEIKFKAKKLRHYPMIPFEVAGNGRRYSDGRRE